MENNEENQPPKPQTPIHKSSPFSSSPLKLIRNFASLSNRGSPSSPRSPLGRFFGKVRIFELWQNFAFMKVSCVTAGELEIASKSPKLSHIVWKSSKKFSFSGLLAASFCILVFRSLYKFTFF